MGQVNTTKVEHHHGIIFHAIVHAMMLLFNTTSAKMIKRFYNLKFSIFDLWALCSIQTGKAVVKAAGHKHQPPKHTVPKCCTIQQPNRSRLTCIALAWGSCQVLLTTVVPRWTGQAAIQALCHGIRVIVAPWTGKLSSKSGSFGIKRARIFHGL